jgi:hypothetical protein
VVVPVVMVEVEQEMDLRGTAHLALTHAAAGIITVVTPPLAELAATILGQLQVAAVPVPVVGQVVVSSYKHIAI